MERKITSGIMLTLLLISMLTLAFDIQSVKASGTIYIRADGSIDPPTANITTVDNITYTFTGNIYDSIVVEKDNVIIDGASYIDQGTGAYGSIGISMDGRKNVTIRNMEIRAFWYGIILWHSSNNSIFGNNITANNGGGISLVSSSNYNSIVGNIVANNGGGISLDSSSRNNITGNTFINDGLSVGSPYQNTVVNNTVNGKPLLYLEGISHCSVGDVGQVILVDCDYIRVENLDLSDTDDAVQLHGTNNSIISRNNITNSLVGILLCHSSNNSIVKNNIRANSGCGIGLIYSSNSSISGNNITYNSLGISLSESSNNNTLRRNNITNNENAIYLSRSSNNSIFGNNITANSEEGIHFWCSNNNSISGNDITANGDYGILLYDYSYHNTIFGNNITNNDLGVRLFRGPSNNLIYHNNFVNNTDHANSYRYRNVWDDGYPSGGNYWSDYEERYPDAEELDGSGIWDTPYAIDGNNQDNYPLVNPWTPPAEPRTWTVDDDGPADFHTIQEAINAASPGDTIYVYNGTYYENVVLNKTVSLIGENRERTIIDGSGIAEAIAIIVNNTNLDSFTIQSSSKTAIRLENVSGTAIVSNTITNSVNGLILGFSNHNTIAGNNITQNMFSSNFVNSSHNILTDNTIDGLYFSNCLNNTLANNTIGSFMISYSPSNKLRNNSIWTFGVYGNMYSHFVQNIDSSNTVNTKPIYYWINRENDEVPSDAGYVALINSTNVTVGNLNLESKLQGILLFSTKNSRIQSNNLIDINHGIWLIWSSNNTISRNSIAEGVEGIHFEYSSNNIVSGNNITNNSEGIRLTKSSSNIFCHNNIIDNQKQVYLYESFDNVWDDGYPSGGNYWSDYKGTDANQDGIGDSSYEIDTSNQDRYPLMGPFNAFDAGTWNNIAYSVNVASNSTVSDFYFNPDEGAFIRFNVSGPEGTTGFCRVVIPKELLWVEDGQWAVLVGGEPVEYVVIPDENCTYICFTYSHTTKTVEIIGTNVVPEFPTWASMLLILILLAVAIAIYKRRLIKTPTH